jgi:hypothetical protein
MYAPVESGTGGDGADGNHDFVQSSCGWGQQHVNQKSGRGISAYERVWRIHGLITRGMTGLTKT